MAKITLIIPAYNAESCIKKCLDSCFGQTYQNLEVLVIDDCSNDTTANIVLSCNDKRLRYVKNEENMGLSVARNVGLEHATGEFITFVDSDDYIDNDFCSLLIENAIAHGADISLGSMRRIRTDKVKLFSQPNGIWTDFTNKLKATRTAGVWAKLYRLDFLRQNFLTFSKGRMWEDSLFTLQALYYSGIVSTEERACYNYVLNYDSLTYSRTTTEKKIDDGLFIAQEAMNFFMDKNCDQLQRKLIVDFLSKNVVVRPETNGLEHFKRFEEILGRNPFLSKLRRKYIKKALKGQIPAGEGKIDLIKAYF